MKLIDTSVVVDIDRGGVADRVAKLDEEGRHALSVISVTELRLGVNKRFEAGERAEPMDALDRLLARFDVLEIDRPTAAAAADIIDNLSRRGAPLDDLHDIYIGATARTEQLPILTANVSDFDRMQGVRVVDWHEL